LAIEPDETLREARASESELSRDERMTLQEALKWYGFYTSGIDGAFGQGTRASMSAWQEASGFEPTGVLTTRQRATLVTNHAADLAEFGFESVTEAEAGIEITLPLSLVAFDHYEPPFVHFAEKDGSRLRVLLFSEPGGPEALAGLYDILQTLEAVPMPRQRLENQQRHAPVRHGQLHQWTACHRSQTSRSIMRSVLCALLHPPALLCLRHATCLVSVLPLLRQPGPAILQPPVMQWKVEWLKSWTCAHQRASGGR
jgi:hypothetical protein